MARTFAAAFAAVAGPKLDDAAGFTRRPHRRTPTEPAVSAAFTGLDYEPFRRIARRLAAHQRCEPGHSEEAVQEGIAYLLEKDPSLFRESPLNWLGLLYEVSKHRLHVVRRGQGRAASIEALVEGGAENVVERAVPCLAPEQRATGDYRDVLPPPQEEAWNATQILGALQRFHWYHARAPRARECGPAHLLPSEAVVRRHFGSFTDALLAAGIAPDVTRRRGRWTPVEAAEACRSFRWRNQRWPDGIDADRNPGILPSRHAMQRFFDGTNAAEVQIGAEAIIAAGD